MNSNQAKWQGRCKQAGGTLYRLWGRLTRDSDCEFRGNQLIIEGKLQAYYACGRVAAHGDRRQSRIGSLIERRRAFHVVA
jgi:uncharacterized protein YjbJ (UPF0337 family)